MLRKWLFPFEKSIRFKAFLQFSNVWGMSNTSLCVRGESLLLCKKMSCLAHSLLSTPPLGACFVCPTLQGPCGRSLKWRGTLRFLPPHIFLGIWKSMCILRVGSSSDTIWDGPKLSSVTDLQALHKQNVKAKVNCTLLGWVLKVCCDTHTEPPCNDWKVFGGFLLLF